MRFACQRRVSAGAILDIYNHKSIRFDIFIEFLSFLRWGTLFTEGGHYSLVNNVRGDNIHGGTVFIPTPGPRRKLDRVHFWSVTR